MNALGPTIKRGVSKQDYATPADFIAAVTKRFGAMEWDLAATKENTKAPRFITPEIDSLKQVWPTDGSWCWLNPPFDNIEPWVAKVAKASVQGARILFLTPASVGSNWFERHVHKKARVLFLSPRLCFDGKAPYPKDCMLTVWNWHEPGYECWRWKP
jgi:DNA (cytosine-5)-methyltransferase 1